MFRYQIDELNNKNRDDYFDWPIVIKDQIGRTKLVSDSLEFKDGKVYMSFRKI